MWNSLYPEDRLSLKLLIASQNILILPEENKTTGRFKQYIVIEIQKHIEKY
jgi:hypothetical protein